MKGETELHFGESTLAHTLLSVGVEALNPHIHRAPHGWVGSKFSGRDRCQARSRAMWGNDVAAFGGCKEIDAQGDQVRDGDCPTLVGHPAAEFWSKSLQRDVQPASVGELVATDEGAHASQLVVEQVATSFAKNTQTWLCTARKEVSVGCTLKWKVIRGTCHLWKTVLALATWKCWVGLKVVGRTKFCAHAPLTWALKLMSNENVTCPNDANNSNCWCHRFMETHVYIYMYIYIKCVKKVVQRRICTCLWMHEYTQGFVWNKTASTSLSFVLLNSY